MKEVRFGIVGTGKIAEIHAKSISEIQNARLVAAAGTNGEKTGKLANDFGCEPCRSPDELLSRKDVDAVCILTPSGLHADAGIEAARAGKHVLVEKPIDVSLEKADELIKECERNGVRLGVVSQRRYSDAVMDVIKAVTGGEMGKIGYGGAQIRWYRSQEYYDSADWRGTWKLDGGGALMNQSVHYVDLLQYIVGPIEEVYGYSRTMAHDIEVEDLLVGSLKFKNGALGLIEATTAAYPGMFSRLDVYGEKGTAAIVDDELDALISMDGTELTKKREKPANNESVSGPKIPFVLHKKQIENFVDSIINGTEPEIGGRDGRNALAVVLALYESCKTGKPVKVDSI